MKPHDSWSIRFPSSGDAEHFDIFRYQFRDRLGINLRIDFGERGHILEVDAGVSAIAATRQVWAVAAVRQYSIVHSNMLSVIAWCRMKNSCLDTLPWLGKAP